MTTTVQRTRHGCTSLLHSNDRRLRTKHFWWFFQDLLLCVFHDFPRTARRSTRIFLKYSQRYLGSILLRLLLLYKPLGHFSSNVPTKYQMWPKFFTDYLSFTEIIEKFVTTNICISTIFQYLGMIPGLSRPGKCDLNSRSFHDLYKTLNWPPSVPVQVSILDEQHKWRTTQIFWIHKYRRFCPLSSKVLKSVSYRYSAQIRGLISNNTQKYTHNTHENNKSWHTYTYTHIHPQN